MKRLLGSTWSVAAVLAIMAPACTTGVQDSGFTGFTSAPPPAGGTMDGGGGTDDGVATMGGTADGTAGTDPPDPPDPADSTDTTDPNDTTDPSTTTDPTDTSDPTTAGSTGEPACNEVAGNYESCLDGGAVDTSGCGGGDPACITVGTPPIAGFCSQTDCVDTCDCPLADSGNATLTCSAITGDETNFCNLDCSAGETCPTGMECYAGQLCIWEGEGADGTPFGDCLNNDFSVCGLEGVCLNDDVDAPTIGVCTADCPGGIGDCGAAPPGGTASVSCQDVTDDGTPECVIDCSFGTCPTGMTCFAGFLCAWD